MKTSFELYIEANNALAKCFQAVSYDQYKALSAVQQGDLCKAEKKSVTDLLTANKVGFANLVQERLAAAGHQ